MNVIIWKKCTKIDSVDINWQNGWKDKNWIFDKKLIFGIVCNLEVEMQKRVSKESDCSKERFCAVSWQFYWSYKRKPAVKVWLINCAIMGSQNEPLTSALPSSIVQKP